MQAGQRDFGENLQMAQRDAKDSIIPLSLQMSTKAVWQRLQMVESRMKIMLENNGALAEKMDLFLGLLMKKGQDSTTTEGSGRACKW